MNLHVHDTHRSGGGAPCVCRAAAQAATSAAALRGAWRCMRRPGARRRARIVAWSAMLVLVSGDSLRGQAPARVVDEYRVKAAFVYRFTQFVTWPAPAIADATTLDLCITRPSPFGAELERLVQGEMVEGRALRVREISGPDEIAGCHAIFVGDAAAGARDVLQAAAGRHVLTIGESERFLDEGGVITLRVINRRVRFEVDAANARKAGLRVAAQLLNLAVAVRGGPS